MLRSSVYEAGYKQRKALSADGEPVHNEQTMRNLEAKLSQPTVRH